MDVVDNIVGVLLSHVKAAEIAGTFRHPTENQSAYDYLKLGNMYGYQAIVAGLGSPRSVELALLGGEAYEKAIELDPNYAEPYARLSTNLIVSMPPTRPRPEGMRERRLELAEKAIQLDPNLAYGYYALATALRSAKRPEEGLAKMRKAVELNPNDADILARLGNETAANGLLEEAIAAGELALRLNPYAKPHYYNWLGKAYCSAHDYKSVLDTAQVCVALFPTYVGCYQILLSALVRLGQLDRARLAAADALERIPDFARNFLPYGSMRLHFKAEREQVWEDLRSLGIAIPEDA